MPPPAGEGQSATTTTARSLFLRREELDNPHKEKTWAVFTEDFAVGVRMEVVQQQQQQQQQ